MAKKTNSKVITPKLSQKSWFEQVLSGEKYTKRHYSILFFIIGFALYFNTIGNDFAMDDSLVTLKHRYVTQGFKGIPDILTSPYMDEDRIKGEFRPLAQITFAIEYEFFGENPNANHFFNTVLYGLILMLIYRLFTAIFEDKYHKYILFGLFIFAIHPLHTEVVASIKNRENLLGALFGLLSTLQALKHIQSDKIKHLFFSTLFLLMAMTAKIDSIVFIFYTILVAIYLKKYKYIWPYLVIAIVLFIAFAFYKRNIMPDSFRLTEFHETPLIGEDDNLANRFKLSMLSLWWYIRLNILPYPLRFYYGTGIVNLPTWSNPLVWFSFTLHSVMLFFGIKGLIQKKFYGFNILWYMGSIFLFSQLPEPVTGIIAERHAFIASIGFSMLFAFFTLKAYEHLSQKKKELSKWLMWSVAVLMIFYIGLTLKRNTQWYDADTLYAADKDAVEGSIFAHFEMGNQHARGTGIDQNAPIYKEKLQLSIEEYKKVLKHMPDHVSTNYNIAVAYLRATKFKEGKQAFLRTRELDSTFRSVNHLIGVCSYYLEEYDDAIEYFKKELTLKPNNSSSTEILYLILSKQKDYQQVLDILEPVAEKGVVNTRLLKALANGYYYTGNEEKAMEYRKRVELKDYEEDENTEW